MKITSENPATGEVIREYEEMTPEHVATVIDEAHGVFLEWRKTSFDHRATLMRRTAALLRARSDEYARLMALEMGKPVSGGKAEVQKCAWVCDLYADRAEEFLADEVIESDARRSYVAHRPLGVVLAVMPWNFPFWQVFRFAAPALMAGNVGILKHASNVPGSALAIEQVFRDAGFPGAAFRALIIGSRRVAEVIRHPRVVAVTLTGSTPAGQSVASISGSQIKKTVLELGGSDAYLVLEDADLDLAVKSCVASRLVNSGQSCIAAKRFIVLDAVHDEFTGRFVERMAAARMGDPLDPAVEVGPQARWDLRDELHRQVMVSVEKGARLLLGGRIPDGQGAYYPPTVLAGVHRGMPAFDEELFGPVAAIVRARDEDEAVALANDSIFGLGAAVFTRDAKRGERIAADRLDAGLCFVNALVRSDPRLPFGGIKTSGYGRELSHHGIREFVNEKTVYLG